MNKKRTSLPMQKSWFVMPYVLKNISVKGNTEFRYPESFVKKFLLEFTSEGDKVFDPFAGFGTTLLVAQKMKRVGIGVEYDKKRCLYVTEKLQSPSKIIHGDSRRLRSLHIPKCDFSITSPPYMQEHHKQNPLTNYTKSGDYKTYLKGMKTVYTQVKEVMRKNAFIVLEVSNTYGKRHGLTPLAWDVAKIVSEIFFLEKEIIYCHENTGDHSYCLLFRNARPQ